MADGLRGRSVAKRALAFLGPLGLLMPKIKDGEQNNDNLLRDWTLTLVAAAYGCTIALMVGILALGRTNRVILMPLLSAGGLYVYPPIRLFNVRLDFGNGVYSRFSSESAHF